MNAQDDRPSGATKTNPAPSAISPTRADPPDGPLPPVDAEARRWAMIAHLSALIGLAGNGIGFFLGPLIVWALKKDAHPYIDRHGKEAMNFQLSVIIAGAVAVALAFTIVGILIAIPLLILVAVMAVVFPIVAAIRVNDGHDYRYPLSWRLIE